MVQHQGPKLSKATPHKIHQFSVSLKYSTIKKTTFLKTSINSAPESLKKKSCEKIQKFTFFHIYSPLNCNVLFCLCKDTAVNTIVANVTAFDADSGTNGEISYQILAGNEDGSFKVTPNTGTIKIVKALDYERIQSYSVS